ncbi:DUF1761 domain-containing protein [Polaribacter aestuariivivens]|uniref:DUF1761 domain-containing protein n=1 Tax=Polaribacter aestuariivivens TaxID=2304626 RepID=A0A5S3NAD9_9FLAO|nr:DUF1761 domain-containing protein [Polaribacter aestuariivivens]TMM30569.1 DUF1761 domain-containing protein [Polaribacter aestuariivivens]
MEMNFYIFFLAALVPMIVGFIWYGPLFGNAWMQQMGFTKESLEGTNMVKTLIISYILSVLIAFALMPMVIHQMGVYSTLAGDPGFNEQTGEAYSYFENFVATYSDRFRTFKHGAFHGVLFGVFLIMPILGIQALFEKKSFKYIAINAGYWIATLAIMGGIICQWM